MAGKLALHSVLGTVQMEHQVHQLWKEHSRWEVKVTILIRGSARCYWYTQFRGNYLFHSVLYNKNGTLMDGRLGMPLSHGCVRLNINNAKWIYDTIPAGSTVVVYH